MSFLADPVRDENKVHLRGPSGSEADVIRESDCVYQVKFPGWARAKMDFSKLVRYETRGDRLRLFGEEGLWCNNFKTAGRVL